MRKTVFGWALMAAAMLFLSPTASRAAVEMQEMYPLQGIIYNMCNGEAIQVEGHTRVQVRVTYDQAGGVHYAYSMSTQATGVGLTTGARYQANGRFGEWVNATHAFEATYRSVMRFNSLDKNVPDFYSNIHYHGVFTPSFIQGGSVQIEESSCR